MTGVRLCIFSKNTMNVTLCSSLCMVSVGSDRTWASLGVPWRAPEFVSKEIICGDVVGSSMEGYLMDREDLWRRK